MEKIKLDKELVFTDFLYIWNTDGQKVFGDKLVIYENCGIAMYNKDNMVSYVEGNEIEVKKWEEDIFIFAKNITPFSFIVVYKEPSKLFPKESFKAGDKVLKLDDAIKIEFDYYIKGVELCIEEIKQKYEYIVTEINLITDDFKVVKIKNDTETVQVLESDLISFSQIFKNANILIDIGKTRLPFQIE